MQTVTLEAELRTAQTKGSRRALRQQGLVPAVVYHKGEQSMTIAVKESQLRKLVYTTESHLVNLKLSNGTERQAVMKDTQFDPVTESILHADFQILKADEPLDIEVPTMFKGTPAGAIKGGRVQVILHKLMVRSLPADIPEHIEFDITHMDLNDTLHVGDANKLYASEKWKILGDETISIVSIVAPRAEVSATAAAEAATAEPEVITKGKEKAGEKTDAKK